MESRHSRLERLGVGLHMVSVRRMLYGQEIGSGTGVSRMDAHSPGRPG